MKFKNHCVLLRLPIDLNSSMYVLGKKTSYPTRAHGIIVKKEFPFNLPESAVSEAQLILNHEWICGTGAAMRKRFAIMSHAWSKFAAVYLYTLFLTPFETVV